MYGPFAPDKLGRVVQRIVGRVVLFDGHRERQLPFTVFAHRLHELIGDQQRQVELAQTAVLALGADELHGIGMPDIEGGHLRTAAATGRRHGETHLVVDIHERQRAGGMRTGAGDVCTLGAQGGKFIADAAAGFQGKPCFMHLVENVIH